MLAICIAVLLVVGVAAVPRARAAREERRIDARRREIAAR